MFRIGFLVKDTFLAEVLHLLPEGKCYDLEVQPVKIEPDAQPAAQPQPATTPTRARGPDRKPRAKRGSHTTDNHSPDAKARKEHRQQVVANAIAAMPSEFGTSDLFAEINKAGTGVGSTYMYKLLREEIDAGRIVRLDTGSYRKLGYGVKPVPQPSKATEQPAPTPLPETPAETRGFPFWR